MGRNILISFVGANDAGKLVDTKNSEGAIITALQNESFDEVYLIWNQNNLNNSF